ncbi:hypothetical protein [Nostoc sp.]
MVCSLFDARLKNHVLIAAMTSVEIVAVSGSIIATNAIAATTTPNV